MSIILAVPAEEFDTFIDVVQDICMARTSYNTAFTKLAKMQVV
jgi:hypothetical protein